LIGSHSPSSGRLFWSFNHIHLDFSYLGIKGISLHVVLIGFYSCHNIHAITILHLQGDVSSSDSTFDLFSSLTVIVFRCDYGEC
jgi:hypothetical protein